MFIILRRIERWLHQHIFKVGWLVTHNYQTTTILYYTFFLPGVVLHEVIYWLVAGALNVRAERSLKWPEPQEIGELKLNFVKISPRANLYRKAVITISPLIVSLVLIWLIASNVFDINLVLDTMSSGELTDIAAAFGILTSATDFWLWIYVIFTISNTMYPAIPKDLQGWRVLLGGALVIGLVLTVIGLGGGIFTAIASPLTSILTVLQATLIFMIAIDVIMVLVLGSIEAAIERVTGHTATFRGGKMSTMTRQEAQEERERLAEQERRRRERERRRAEEQATPITIYSLAFPIPGGPNEETITQLTDATEAETTPPAIDFGGAAVDVEPDSNDGEAVELPLAERINLPQRPAAQPEPIASEETAARSPIKLPEIQPFSAEPATQVPEIAASPGVEETATAEEMVATPTSSAQSSVEDTASEKPAALTRDTTTEAPVEAPASDGAGDDLDTGADNVAVALPAIDTTEETSEDAVETSDSDDDVDGSGETVVEREEDAPSIDADGDQETDDAVAATDAVDEDESEATESEPEPEIAARSTSRLRITPFITSASDDEDEDSTEPDQPATVTKSTADSDVDEPTNASEVLASDPREAADVDDERPAEQRVTPKTERSEAIEDEEQPDIAARLEQLRARREQTRPASSRFSKPGTSSTNSGSSRFGVSPFRTSPTSDGNDEDEAAQRPATSRFSTPPAASTDDTRRRRSSFGPVPSDAADDNDDDAPSPFSSRFSTRPSSRFKPAASSEPETTSDDESANDEEAATSFSSRFSTRPSSRFKTISSSEPEAAGDADDGNNEEPKAAEDRAARLERLRTQLPSADRYSFSRSRAVPKPTRDPAQDDANNSDLDDDDVRYEDIDDGYDDEIEYLDDDDYYEYEDDDDYVDYEDE